VCREMSKTVADMRSFLIGYPVLSYEAGMGVTTLAEVAKGLCRILATDGVESVCMWVYACDRPFSNRYGTDSPV